MKDMMKNLILGLVVGIELTIGAWLLLTEQPTPSPWTEVIPMANTGITWQGAGYNGIYGD